MLVIRRSIGQSIRINDNIRIVIQEIQDGRVVRFAIEAPPEVPVHRMEVYNLIQEENRSATSGDALAWLKQDETADEPEQR